MKQLSIERKIEMSACTNIALMLAHRGHTCYVDLYELRVQLDIHCDTIMELQDAQKVLKTCEYAYKKKEIKKRLHEEKTDFRKWYLITLEF